MEMHMKNDMDVKQDVEKELRWDPGVHAEQIGVCRVTTREGDE